MKHPQRLDEKRLIEALCERGLLKASVLAEHKGRGAAIHALVSEGAIGDWDLSRVVSEVFHLPFLPVDLAQPDRGLLDELPNAALREHGLIPICRQGGLLTVAMPGMVEAKALAQVGEETGLQVAPVVGTVLTNRRWLDENPRLPEGKPLREDDEGYAEWEHLFDEGDAAVHMKHEESVEPPSISPGPSPEAIEAKTRAPSALPPPPHFD